MLWYQMLVQVVQNFPTSIHCQSHLPLQLNQICRLTDIVSSFMVNNKVSANSWCSLYPSHSSQIWVCCLSSTAHPYTTHVFDLNRARRCCLLDQNYAHVSMMTRTSSYDIFDFPHQQSLLLTGLQKQMAFTYTSRLQSESSVLMSIVRSVK